LSDVTGPVFWPGYNFVGPGNELTSDVIPVSSVDAIAQMHDYAYGQRTLATEHYDDKQLLKMWTEWGKAYSGDGWSGPTHYEKYFVIPSLLGLMTTIDNTDHFTEKRICGIEC
jgi:hypothetical protein